jgi:hypothetical protein
MSFSPGARPQQSAGNNKHQMRVTHSALGLHIAGQPPERSATSNAVQPGLAPRKKARSGSSRKKWSQRNELGTNLAAMRRKRSEYAPISMGSHSQGLRGPVRWIP